MQYTTSIEIDLPRDRVLELFDDQENLPKWLRGLLSTELLEGEPGQVGAKTRMVFAMGKREIDMVEEITKRNLPDEFDCTYDAKGCFNIVKNTFVELGPDKTRWDQDQEFQMSGFMMKLMAFLMPGAFKKQSMKHAMDFKAFAENGTDVRETA